MKDSVPSVHKDVETLEHLYSAGLVHHRAAAIKKLVSQMLSIVLPYDPESLVSEEQLNRIKCLSMCSKAYNNVSGRTFHKGKTEKCITYRKTKN